MKHMPFERPTDYYDNRIINIDEQLCELIKLRKEISNNNPGFPPLEIIAEWARKFELYEDLLRSVFGVLRNEEHYRPVVEPTGFRKHVPVMKSFEVDERLYSVTSIRQYNNASVLYFYIDWDATNEQANRTRNRFFELYIGERYNCRMASGGGSAGHLSYSFVVYPALPDDISGHDLAFKEYSAPFKDRPTGLEIIFHVE